MAEREDVQAFGEWWPTYWMGKAGPPRLDELRNEWGRFMAIRKGLYGERAADAAQDKRELAAWHARKEAELEAEIAMRGGKT